MDSVADQKRFVERVKTYYDKNTPRFFRSHESSIGTAIHREVWGPGVIDKKVAYEYLNRLILNEIGPGLSEPTENPIRVLDLGCGVGGTLFFLAERLSIRGLGITLSRVQVEIAEKLAHERNLEGECEFLQSSYLEIPDDRAPASCAYAIESFVHGPDPAEFFRASARAIESGGKLILCDDFLTRKGDRHDRSSGGRVTRENRKARRWISDFRKGWRLGSLITSDRAVSLANDAGFRLKEDSDLTPYLALERPCDRIIATAVKLGRWVPIRSAWWDSWLGGHAIQQCLLSGLIKFRYLVFVKD